MPAFSVLDASGYLQYTVETSPGNGPPEIPVGFFVVDGLPDTGKVKYNQQLQSWEAGGFEVAQKVERISELRAAIAELELRQLRSMREITDAWLAERPPFSASVEHYQEIGARLEVLASELRSLVI